MHYFYYYRYLSVKIYQREILSFRIKHIIIDVETTDDVRGLVESDDVNIIEIAMIIVNNVKKIDNNYDMTILFGRNLWGYSHETLVVDGQSDRY